MIVVDASVVFKWFSTSEPYYKEAQELLSPSSSDAINISVPDFIYLELSNAWSTKQTLPYKEVKRNLQALFELKLNMHHVTPQLLFAAIQLSTSHAVSVYDALYAALAKEMNCDLITADEKFVRQVNLSYIKLLGK